MDHLMEFQKSKRFIGFVRLTPFGKWVKSPGLFPSFLLRSRFKSLFEYIVSVFSLAICVCVCVFVAFATKHMHEKKRHAKSAPKKKKNSILNMSRVSEKSTFCAFCVFIFGGRRRRRQRSWWWSWYCNSSSSSNSHATIVPSGVMRFISSIFFLFHSFFSAHKFSSLCPVLFFSSFRLQFGHSCDCVPFIFLQAIFSFNSCCLQRYYPDAVFPRFLYFLSTFSVINFFLLASLPRFLSVLVCPAASSAWKRKRLLCRQNDSGYRDRAGKKWEARVLYHYILCVGLPWSNSLNITYTHTNTIFLNELLHSLTHSLCLSPSRALSSVVRQIESSAKLLSCRRACDMEKILYMDFFLLLARDRRQMFPKTRHSTYIFVWFGCVFIFSSLFQPSLLFCLSACFCVWFRTFVICVSLACSSHRRACYSRR